MDRQSGYENEYWKRGDGKKDKEEEGGCITLGINLQSRDLVSFPKP